MAFMDLYSWPVVGGILGSVRRRELKEQAVLEIVESRGEQMSQARAELAKALVQGNESNIAKVRQKFDLFHNRLNEGPGALVTKWMKR